MARLERSITIDGQVLNVPQYLNRTVSGWQVRVRDQPSQHFADAHHGGAAQALAIAAGVEMQSAFEAKYQRDWNDPASDEMKAVWADAWAAARGATNLQSDWAAQEVEDRASESAAIRRAP